MASSSKVCITYALWGGGEVLENAHNLLFLQSSLYTRCVSLNALVHYIVAIGHFTVNGFTFVCKSQKNGTQNQELCLKSLAVTRTHVVVF